MSNAKYIKSIALLIGAGVQFGLLIINLVITSKMQIDDRGSYALIVAVVMTVSGVCNFGFTNALIKRLHIESLSISYCFKLFKLILLQILFALMVVFLLLLSFPVITFEVVSELWPVITILIVSLLLRSYGQGYLLGLSKINLFQFSKILPVFLFALVLIFYNAYHLADVLYAWMLSEVLLILFLVLSTSYYFKFNKKYTEEFWVDLKFGLKSLLGHTAFIEGYKFDVIMLGYILPAADLAIYAVSKSVALVLRFVPQSLSQVAYPSILKAEDKNKLKVVNKFVLVSIISGSILLLIGFYLFKYFVIGFLGEAYIGSEFIVLLMFLGVLAYVPRRIQYEYFKASNRPEIPSKIELFVVLAYAVLLFSSELLIDNNLYMLSLLVLIINIVALISTFKLAVKQEIPA